MQLSRTWLREPLVHFVALGGALFALYHAVAPVPPGRRIDVDASVVAGLTADHTRRYGSPASDAERAALVRQYVDHELLYREALALGLDRGDVIVRRRLIQKMQFLLEELDPTPEPSDAELAAYRAAHAAAYAVPELFTIEHVFVARQGRADAAADAATLRQRLLAGADAQTLGDPFVHGHVLRSRSTRELAALFGAGFAAAVTALPDGQWSAPLASPFGHHVVRVLSRQPAAATGDELAAQRESLRRDWQREARARLDRRALERLRARYQVRVAGVAP